MQLSKGVQVVAGVEALKGVAILVVGFGLLTLLHRDVQAIAEEIVRHSHLNPASRYPQIFVQAAGAVNDTRLWFLAGCAAGYASLRLIEAYGLWRRRTWAGWFAIISSAIYLPFEIRELTHRTNYVTIALFIINLVIVFYLINSIRKARHATA